MRKMILLLLLTFAVLVLALPAAAQDYPVIVSGLNNPRGLAFDENGVLWITEAGTSGPLTGMGDFGPVSYGGSARVLALAPGDAEAAVVIGGLPSSTQFDDIVGVNSIYAQFGGIWLVNGIGPLADPFNMAVIQLDQETLRIGRVIDLYSFEAQNNPDGEDIQTNPADIAVSADDVFYIADASGNAVLKWTIDGGLEVFHVWEDLPVPTSVDVDVDGNVYVGFLSAYPYSAGTAKVEKWSPAGELLATYDNLTAVTDVLVAADGTIYAVQLSRELGATGFIGDSGSVVTLSESGATPVAEGLNFPYRLAQSTDGALVVTLNSAFSGEGNGQVILLSGEMGGAAAS